MYIMAIQVVQQILLLLLVTGIREMISLRTDVISTKTGKVQGFVVPSSLPGKKVQKFLNIPYAEAPVGKLRFSTPQPKKPWNGTLNSSSEAIACWQNIKLGPKLTEDCLILNIWTPYPKPRNATVMIWIHGGSLANGHVGMFPGQNFVAIGDVILVTINYRLSALGFLTSSDDRIKGNFGFFDQRLAMKWVQENIAYFGGNPKSITLFGGSAGALSVSAHTLSKESWPYFNRAILQSGSMIAPFAVWPEVINKQTFRTFLSLVNCKDDENLLECLRENITDSDLRNIYNTKPFILSNSSFGAHIDGDFFTDHPKVLWNKKQVKEADIILGITKDESFFIDGQALLSKTRNISLITKLSKDKMKQQLVMLNYSTTVYNEAVKLYSPNNCVPSFVEALKPLVAFSSDLWFICAARTEANLRSQILNSTNVYLYQYSYSTPIPYIRLYPEGTFEFAAHAEELPVTFGRPVNNPQYPPEDKILSMRMILYWTNFAKTGDPNLGTTKLPVTLNGIESLPKWPKFTSSRKEYLDMESLSRMIVRRNLRERYCDFWDDPEGFIAKQAVSSAESLIPRFAVFLIAVLVAVF